MIGNTLVNHPNEVGRIAGRQFEAEIALGIGLGAGRFFHALRQVEQDDFIAAGGLVARTILDRAGQGLRRGETAEGQYETSCGKFEGGLQILAPFFCLVGELAGPADEAAASRRAISARMAAASSSREVFMAW